MYYPYMRQNTMQKRLMTIIGNDSITVQPDMVTIQLAIVTENEDLQIAQLENTERSNQVINSLLNLGVSQEDIQTSVYHIQPMYDFIDGRQVLRGYRVEHSLSVDIQNIDQTGIIIDTAVQNGVNQISSLQFSVMDKQKYYREALNLAIKDAIAKAESIASTLHLNLDTNPIKIEEEISQQPIVFQTFAMEKGSQATPIQPGQILIEATVRTQFQYSS